MIGYGKSIVYNQHRPQYADDAFNHNHQRTGFDIGGSSDYGSETQSATAPQSRRAYELEKELVELDERIAKLCIF